MAKANQAAVNKTKHGEAAHALLSKQSNVSPVEFLYDKDVILFCALKAPELKIACHKMCRIFFVKPNFICHPAHQTPHAF